VAGKRAGLGGSRSGLFWEICRLLDETRAQNFILENVPGLLSSNQGADMAVVLEALVERGYRIAYRVLDAQHFGVPQRRRRVFIVGSLGDTGRSPEEILAIAQSRAGYLAQSKSARKDTATATAGSTGDSSAAALTSFSPSSFAEYIENEKVSATLRAGGGDLGGGSETLLLDGAVYGQSGFAKYTEGVTTLTATSYKRPEDNVVLYENSVFPIDDARELEKHQNGTGIGEKGAPAYTLDRQQAPAIVVAPTLSASNNPSRSPQSSEITAQVDAMVRETGVVRRLTPMECERLQGFPDNWTDGQADSNRYKQMGNAVAVPVVQWIISQMVGEDA
jgi:DNA (cytosine-5)-methyltransferase 1